MSRFGSRRGSRPGQPLRLGFFGVLGSGSLGNDGSLDAMIGYLRDRHPEAELGFLAMGPERLAERYGAPATHLQWFEANADRFGWLPSVVLKVLGRLLDPFRALAWVRHYDILIVPGMGVLETTIPMRPWGFPYGLFTVCLAARIAGVKVAMVSVGADIIHKRVSRWLIVGAARLSHYRSYRDAHSRHAMQRMGVAVDADGVYPDLAFLHPVPAAEPDGTGTVGLGLMDYWGNNDEREHAEQLHRNYVETMTRFACWVVDAGRPIRFFTCDPVDAEVITAVIDGVRAQRPGLDDDMMINEAAGTIQELMEQIARVDTVVATRYHNVVSAVQLSVPTVSISYSPKHDELMANAGLDGFCQPARAVDFDRLVDQFRAVEGRRGELISTMGARNRESVRAVREQFAAVSATVLGASGTPDRPAHLAPLQQGSPHP